MEKEKEEYTTLIEDLIASYLILVILVIGILFAKSEYNLYKQKAKTLQAMQLSISLHKDNTTLKNEIQQNTFIIEQIDKYYRVELQKRDKYEKIIKDIDRNWNTINEK